MGDDPELLAALRKLLLDSESGAYAISDHDLRDVSHIVMWQRDPADLTLFRQLLLWAVQHDRQPANDLIEAFEKCSSDTCANENLTAIAAALEANSSGVLDPGKAMMHATFYGWLSVPFFARMLSDPKMGPRAHKILVDMTQGYENTDLGTAPQPWLDWAARRIAAAR